MPFHLPILLSSRKSAEDRTGPGSVNGETLDEPEEQPRKTLPKREVGFAVLTDANEERETEASKHGYLRKEKRLKEF